MPIWYNKFPVAKVSAKVFNIRDGELRKNGSQIFVIVRISHSPKIKTKIVICEISVVNLSTLLFHQQVPSISNRNTLKNLYVLAFLVGTNFLVNQFEYLF